MSKFAEWLNIPLKEPLNYFSLIKANLAHYYFVEIHPFADGNGRTARALEALILYKHGKFNKYCFWSLSNFYAMNRNEYIDNLNAITKTSNIIPFLKFAVSGYLNELIRIKNGVLGKVKKLMLMDYIHYLHREKKTKNIKINQRIVSFMGFLCTIHKIQFRKFINHPIFLGIYVGASVSTINRDVNKITNLKLAIISKDDKGVKYIEPNFELLEQLEYK